MTWLSHIDIGKIREHHNLTTFVETGCWLGDGIAHAIDAGYTELHSCDIGIEYVEKCLERHPKASIEHSESLSYLTKLLPNLNNRCIFWLDAHFPDLYGTNELDETYRIPLIPEIELIKKYKPDYKNDVILCDDMRNFRSTDNPRYRAGELEERFYVDVDWNQFINVLGETHNAQLIRDWDGVMVFIPKENK